MTEEGYKEGQLILIDKPLGWTSFQVVNKVRWLIKKKFHLKKLKVGHAGTLDPLASGLLIVCTGKFTKKIDDFQAQEKEYTGTFTLGATTPSYDAETEINLRFNLSELTEDAVKNNVSHFIGKIQQQPPIFSALKKEGKRLYEYARSGEEVAIPTREILISEFELTRIAIPKVDFRVVCSKGTYIRSLAHDFGKKLNNGAYLSKLRRTKIGDFHVDNAVSIEYLETILR